MNETTDRAAWLEDAMSRCEESLLRICFAYLGDASEKMWLLRITINTCKDVRRSAWFRHVDRSVALDTLAEPSAPCAEYDDALTHAVMSLKRKYREAVLLCYYQGLNGQEATDVLA